MKSSHSEIGLEKKLILKAPRMNQCKRSALFLDRDGVIIKDLHHVSKKKNVMLENGIINLLKYASNCGLAIVIITNQSGISRGYFTWSDYEQVTDELLLLLGDAYKTIDAIYSNGYGPDAPFHSWRKPSPEMLIQASKDLNIDLHSSILIGDRMSDIIAGVNAGLDKVVHVLTGHGKEERGKIVSNIKKSSENSLSSKPMFYFNGNQSGIVLIDSLVDFPLSLFSS